MNKETKTIREWFEGLPEPERSWALANAGSDETTAHGPTLDKRCSSLSRALFSGFIWGRTKEGGDYWSRILRNVMAREPDPDTESSTSEPAESPLLQALRDALTFVELCGDNARLSIPYSSSTAIRDEYADLEKRSGEIATRIRTLLGEQPSTTES